MAKHLLTDTKLRNIKPSNKTIRLSDGAGLYLLVQPTGSLWWRFDYTFQMKRKTISLGVYPTTSLADARRQAEEARVNIVNKIDPSSIRQENKNNIKASIENEKRLEDGLPIVNSFEDVAREWHSKFKTKWTEDHSARLLRRLEKDIFPYIGSRPISEIDALDLLQALQKMELRGVHDSTHRALQNCGQIFRYGVLTRRCTRDPSGDLKGALSPNKRKHHASIIEPKKIGALLRAIDDYQGSFLSKCALKFSALTFCRPGEIRHAEWGEIDIDAKIWRIPAEKMKMRQQHIVPLSNQAIEILHELMKLTGKGKYLFPSERTNSRPMSENTVNAAIRRMGFTKEEMTAHGFRSMASTSLNEMHYNRDHIERQLAHSESNDVRAAYNYAEYLPERIKMMQAWADYLDSLKSGAAVYPFKTNTHR